MNILFQWLWRNIGVIAIVISLISLTLSIISLVRLTNVQKQKAPLKFKKFWAVRYSIFHIFVFICLTIYILTNWKTCISMQLFTQFDGNNVLFLVWIVDIMLLFYDIEIKESKFHRRKMEEKEEQIRDKGIELNLQQRVEEINRAISEMNGSEGKK